jgi:hypothetical protein
MFAHLPFPRPHTASAGRPFFDSRGALAALHERFLEAQRTLQTVHFDVSAPLPCPKAFLSGWSAEAYRAQLKEAWHQAQAKLHHFERNIRAACRPALNAHHSRLGARSHFSPETVRQMLLPLWFACYCDNAAKYGASEARSARPMPAEWLQMAALAALVQVAQTVVMLMVLSRAPTTPPGARPGVSFTSPVAMPPRAPVALRIIPLPLRL